jgi:hypothetical protein
MNQDNIFIKLLFIIYLCHFCVNQDFLLFLHNKYNSVIKFLQNRNKKVKVLETENRKEIEKIKYEDKYLVEIRKMDKEFQFDLEEKEMMENKKKDILQKINDMYVDKMNRISEKLLLIEENVLKKNDFQFESEFQLVTEELNDLKKEIDAEECQHKIIKNAEEESKQFVVEERLKKLNNCFVMEYTPLGNVLMIYDSLRNTFKYYSDNTIPYRYLETVARKYVKVFNCRPIFIDMEEELKLWEDKLNKEKEVEKEKKERETNLHKNQKQIPIEDKKQLFAKFKTYNKEALAGKVNIAPPPKNSIPNQKIEESQKDVLLKEKANMYTYDGKISNYSFLKKIDRKIVDKKYTMSFTEFKKLHNK